MIHIGSDNLAFDLLRNITVRFHYGPAELSLWDLKVLTFGCFFFCVRASVADCIHAVGIDMDILFCSVRKMKYGKFVGGTF